MPAGVLGLVVQAELLAAATSSGLKDVSSACSLCSVKVAAESTQPHAGHPATTEQWLSRLVLGGVQSRVLSQAATAQEVVEQQQLLSQLDLPKDISVITTQPRVLPVCLRLAPHTCFAHC